MKLKALTMTALLGVFLAGSSAFAWSHHGHHHKHHKVKVYKVIKTYVKPVVKPSTWHKHAENGLTNDTYHNHPNGNNHHVHHYGTGGHKHGGHYYAVCPYVH